MGSFANNAITENGRLLLADCQTGGEFQPTKIVIGSGNVPAGKTPGTMTAVVTPVKELQINKKERTNDGKVIIGGYFSNEDITTDFYFRELALYARCVWRDENGDITTTGEEKLYSYGNAGATADLIPAYSTSTVVEKQIDCVSYVGNDTDVDLTIESGVFVTEAQLNAGLATKLGADGDGSDVTVTFTQATTRANISTGEKFKVICGKIAKFFSDIGTAAFCAAEAFASASHNHAAGDINSGTLSAERLPVIPVIKGGTGADNAATARANLGAASKATYSGTLSVEGWSGTEAPYTQSVTISGILATDTPGLAYVAGSDAAAAGLIREAWGYLWGYLPPYTTANAINFYATDKPTVAIPFTAEVVRNG